MARLRDNPDEPSMDEFELLEPRRTFQGFTGPVRGDDGATVGRIWTLREVTRERDVERLKDDFVATVSHELRTPLTSMMGFLELVREGGAGPLTADQERFLDIVHRSSERLQRLVGDLLFVARLDARGVQLDVEAVDVNEVAAEAVEAVGGARARARDRRPPRAGARSRPCRATARASRRSSTTCSRTRSNSPPRAERSRRGRESSRTPSSSRSRTRASGSRGTSRSGSSSASSARRRRPPRPFPGRGSGSSSRRRSSRRTAARCPCASEARQGHVRQGHAPASVTLPHE